MTTAATDVVRQHLIDPEICIRCNTCEESCPIDAITHDERNYVVNPGKCDNCNVCIAPCPTGAIDSWRQVAKVEMYSIEEQLKWDSLPPQRDLADTEGASELPPEVERIVAAASAGQGGASPPPWSAAHPYVNLYPAAKPAVATVSGNFRLTGDGASSDIRHIVLDFGQAAFPVLEGQTIGILPPGTDAQGRPHHPRLYSVASPREGERPRYNNLALTVKRVDEDHEGRAVKGVASNFLCDLAKGDTVNVIGPYGTSFLMPNHPGANLLMVCTGTGSAPMRAMTERRRRRVALNEGGTLMLYFGARSPEVGVLEEIAVDPARWGGGGGRVLLRAATDALARAGHSDAVLLVLADNTRAISLYESEGWVADGADLDADGRATYRRLLTG